MQVVDALTTGVLRGAAFSCGQPAVLGCSACPFIAHAWRLGHRADLWKEVPRGSQLI